MVIDSCLWMTVLLCPAPAPPPRSRCGGGLVGLKYPRATVSLCATCKPQLKALNGKSECLSILLIGLSPDASHGSQGRYLLQLPDNKMSCYSPAIFFRAHGILRPFQNLKNDGVCMLLALLSLTLCDPMNCMYPSRLLCLWDSPGKNTGVDCRSLLHKND